MQAELVTGLVTARQEPPGPLRAIGSDGLPSAGPAPCVAIWAVARRRNQTLTYNRDRGSIAAAALGAAGRPRDL